MNYDQKYDGYVFDLISLFQEAIIRTLSKKPIDLNKFQHYFSKIYDNMNQLQSKFHTETKKITKHLIKLKNFLSKQPENIKLKEDKAIQHHENMIDRPIEQPIVNLKNTYKSVYGSRELKSIEEEQAEDHQMFKNNPGKRRSETANGYRQKFFQNGRPMTGQMGKNRYKNKTIQMPSNPLTEQPQHYTIQLNNQQSYRKNRRQDFYNQLERMKDGEEKGGLCLASYNLPFRKKTRSQQKWVHKINRLL